MKSRWQKSVIAILSLVMLSGVFSTSSLAQQYNDGASSLQGDSESDMDAQAQRLRQGLSGSGAQIIQTADTIRLEMPSALLFANDSSTLSSSVKPVLDHVTSVLRDFPDTGIRIDGYTDSTGKAAYNRQLSQLRAQAVGGYLAQGGIEYRRLTMNGHGASSYIASNSTAAGRQKNRRVTITLVPPNYSNQVIQGQVTPQQYVPGQ